MQSARYAAVSVLVAFLAQSLPATAQPVEAAPGLEVEEAPPVDWPPHIEHLRQEHEIIQPVLEAAANEAGEIASTGQVNVERAQQFLDFFWNYVNRSHHLKEEAYLFPKVRENGDAAVRGLIDSLTVEHAVGRMRLATLHTALSQPEPDPATVAEALGSYARDKLAHADKEVTRLFPLAAEMFATAKIDQVLAGYARIDTQVLGAPARARYHALAVNLAR